MPRRACLKISLNVYARGRRLFRRGLLNASGLTREVRTRSRVYRYCKLFLTVVMCRLLMRLESRRG